MAGKRVNLLISVFSNSESNHHTPKRRNTRTDESTMEEIKEMNNMMSANDWRDRYKGITTLLQMCEMNSNLVAHNIVKVCWFRSSQKGEKTWIHNTFFSPHCICKIKTIIWFLFSKYNEEKKMNPYKILSVNYVPPTKRRATYCVWCVSRRCRYDTFLCTRILMKKWEDRNRISMDITLRHEKDLKSFWWPCSYFQGYSRVKQANLNQIELVCKIYGGVTSVFS